MFIVKLIPSSVLSRQARKPSGLIGRYLMTKIFNAGNADLNSFVKETLNVQRNDRVLEIGFGPGKLINEMAALTTEGFVEGIDFSREMVKEASKENSQFITEGRVKLHSGDCRNLPFDDSSFDKLCSINTLYFWKESEEYFLEMFRVVKPGGMVVIGFRDKEQMSRLDLDQNVFNDYTKDDVIRLLSSAGFSGSEILHKEGKPFLSYCAVGYKA
jgi:ubiquinone/menaquinone biosynthesis C-methylase UbiE